jgi:hypothetical protein
MNDKDIEQEIQAKGLTAPRVTPDHINSIIVSQHFFTAHEGVKGNCGEHYAEQFDSSLKLLTFCVLVLANGFTVTGESACASPENFDPEIGCKIARENAIQKVWMLEGYLLKQRLHEQSQVTSETWFDRLLSESNQLNTRISRLQDYLQTLDTSKPQSNSLCEQLNAMQKYAEILETRIQSHQLAK